MVIDFIRQLAVILDTLKFTRRSVLIAYGYLLWQVVLWYTSVPDPTAEQTAFAGIILGIAPAMFAFYTQKSTKYFELARASRLHRQQRQQRESLDDDAGVDDESFWEDTEPSEFDDTKRL